MRQDKALKIFSDNLDDIKREFGVKSIGVFPWRESPPCGCSCGCDCCAPLAKEIGVAVKYMPGANAGFEFFGLQLRIEELFGYGIPLTHIDGIYPPEWQATIDASPEGRRICRGITLAFGIYVSKASSARRSIQQNLLSYKQARGEEGGINIRVAWWYARTLKGVGVRYAASQGVKDTLR